MAKRPKARSAAAGSDADAKKQKPHVHVCTLAIMIPHDTAPESPKLSAARASQRAAQKADENATSETQYLTGNSELFAKRFEAAVAAAAAKWRRPVTLNEVIIEMTDATGKVKIGTVLRDKLVWNGFKADRWQISRWFPRKKSQVAFPKGAARPSRSSDWRFSPSSCEPSPRSSAGCVVC